MYRLVFARAVMTCGFVLTGLAMTSAPKSAHAQTTVNPNISAIGDMLYRYRDDVARQLDDVNNMNFEFRELELNFDGYLNPYARADVFVAVEGLTGPVALEEVYLTIVRGVPFQIRGGRWFLDIGQINTEHRHQWAWLELPLQNQSFLSEENAGAVGVGIHRLQGIGSVPFTISLNAFRSDIIELGEFGQASAEEEEEGHGHGGEGPSDIGYSGRLGMFVEASPTNFFEVGGSYLYAKPRAEGEFVKTQVAAIDFTYKWVPNSYKGIKLRAESMFSRREFDDLVTGAPTKSDAVGAFSALELKFRRRWDVGGYVDYAQDAFDRELDTRAVGAWFGFMPAEETVRLSLVWRYAESDFFPGTANTVTLQALWSLGPHKPHSF